MPPPPPGGGDYEFEVVELGLPTYFTAPLAVKARGGLTPVGDGEGLVARLAPPRKRPQTGPTKRKRQVGGTPQPEGTSPAEGAGTFNDPSLIFGQIVRTFLQVAQNEAHGPSRAKILEHVTRLYAVDALRDVLKHEPVPGTDIHNSACVAVGQLFAHEETDESRKFYALLRRVLHTSRDTRSTGEGEPPAAPDPAT
jgi:hypothetical protein